MRVADMDVLRHAMYRDMRVAHMPLHLLEQVKVCGRHIHV